MYSINGNEQSVLLSIPGSDEGGNGTGDVYRRLQDPEADASSNSNETDADEYHTLIDGRYKKSSKKYEESRHLGRAIRPIPVTGGNNCSRNRVFLVIIAMFCFITLLLTAVPLGTDKGRVGTIAGWSVNTSRLTINYVLPAENTTIIDPLNICSTEERSGDGSEDEKVFLLIVVCSSAKNFEARQTIRETWGNVSEFNYPQFVRLHARLKGEYLGPRTFKHLQDYMKKSVIENLPMATEDDQQVTELHIVSKTESSKMQNHTSQQSTDKSSQIKADGDTTAQIPTTTTVAPSLWENQNFNVKVVFLLGQSESEYVHQRSKSLHPSSLDQTTTTQAQQEVPTRPVDRRTPSVSLFPPEGDVDPAFNVREAELDELQARIVNESEIYGDIIQESFIDSYNNLTLKTIMMLKWVTNNCDGRVKYIMKCDDDTFVNVPNLLHVLLGGTVPVYKASIPFYDKNTIDVKSAKNRLTEVKRLLTGFLFCEAKPIVDTSSKWYSPNYMYNKEFYPDYLSGTAYLMNLNAAKLLYRTSLTTPIFHLEDVYLTGIVADRTKLRRYHHPLFFYSTIKDLCSLRGMISQHQLQPNELRNAYDFITNQTIVCSAPDRNFTMAKMKLQQRKKCH
ncbi:uncharacterized protein LOC5568339 isoform X1 [Aedes aegypti]|uniref:Uncharacterized protein n=1 Tax=Aedes aegypti TaxID=7159 RepID=A0A6I8T4G0_AEDAE|nr:uncharacterized protein LOC5568339 isoform X1 [Aedes aegypti]